MHAIKSGSDLTHKELRHFGLTFSALVAGVFGLALPWLFSHSWPAWPWVLAACGGGVALLLPGALRRPHDWWQRIGMLLGTVSSSIILTLLFLLVLTPIGLLLRVFGKHALGSTMDADDTTYFETSERRDIKHMERPF